MDCPCKIDHWRHLAIGLAGIVTMMNALTRSGVVPSDDAKRILKAEFEKLKEEVEVQARKAE